jgi:hypothetical protein
MQVVYLETSILDCTTRTPRREGIASRQYDSYSTTCYHGIRCAVDPPAVSTKPSRSRLAVIRSRFDTFSSPDHARRPGTSAAIIMAPNLAIAQREQIDAMLQAGRFTADQIAKVAGCSSQSVSAIQSNIRAFGSPRAPFTAAHGRPRIITQRCLMP